MKKSGIIFLIICVILILTVTGVLADSPYSDVRPGDWFYENVTDMSNFGYLKGYPDGSFRPEFPKMNSPSREGLYENILNKRISAIGNTNIEDKPL